MPRLQDILRFIRVEHSVFALPFVYIGLILAPGDLGFALFVFTTLAAIGARGTAMSLNRIVDRVIDAKNPRTAGRELPAGKITQPVAALLTLLFLGLYFFATWSLNPLVFRLSPIPLAAFIVYPYLKRFTWLCHLFLGFTLGFAPMGGWLAATGAWVGIEVPLLFAFGVMFWVAGFDIIYAILDVDFDRSHKVHSIPADLGVANARVLAFLFHVAMLAFFIAAGLAYDRAGGLLLVPYWLALGVIAGLVLYQHAAVRLDDPGSINKAAFQINGYAGFVLLAGVLVVSYLVDAAALGAGP